MRLFENKSMQTAFEYAKAQTAYYSKSFYWSSQVLPTSKRWDTFALYSFCRYVDNIIDNPRGRAHAELFEEVAAVTRELTIAYRRGESEHPIIKSFIQVALRRDIPLEYPLHLLDGVKMDVLKNRYNTFADLYEFIYRVAGSIGLMMTHVLGYQDKQALVHAEKLGIAMQLTNILRDVKEDKNMNRIYLPLQELRQFGVSEDDVMNERFTDDMFRFMKFQVERTNRYFEEAKPGIALLDRDARFAITSAARIYRGFLRQLEKNGYNPFVENAYISQQKEIAIVFNEVFKTRVVQPTVAMLSSLVG